MKRNLLWKGILILVVVLLAALSAWPLGETINLGLDLRGGVHLVLRVESDDALRSETDKDLDRLVQELKDGGTFGAAAGQTSPSSFEVTGVPASEDAAIADIVEDFLPGWNWERSGDRLEFEMGDAFEKEIRNLAVVQALETIRNRVDAFGVSEPSIQRQGLDGDRIVVQLPGVDDPERVKGLIKNTAFLEFKLVAYPVGGGGVASREEILANYGGRVPDNVEILGGVIRDDAGEVVGEQFYAVEKRAALTGRDLKNARPGLGEFNEPIVNFLLTHEGGQIFAQLTQDNINKGLAVILDGNVITAPRIRSRIADSGMIDGSFTQQEATDLATVLRSGALPAAITYLEERAVGPSLGQDSIERGRRAGLIGLGLVVLTMLLVYRLTGVNAIVALSINIVVIFGVLAYFNATLTLPGIAGIVLTIGMAVDANVLVFERIKEELRHGRTVKSAIDAGFSKALSSVLDANITTLIAALFLIQFGTGPIRGFAVTLSIGILASLFTAIFVSRWLFDVLLSRRERVDALSI